MINKRLAIGIVAALSAAACNGDITNANQNPNDPTDAPSAALFTNATRLGTSRWLGNFDVRGWELLAQHFAEVQYPETDQYKRLRASSTSGNFNGAYNGIDVSIKDTKKYAKSNGWGYYTFGHHPMPYDETSEERPIAECAGCHIANVSKTDMTYIQFYPLLRDKKGY